MNIENSVVFVTGGNRGHELLADAGTQLLKPGLSSERPSYIDPEVR
jgi:hypothetical protein